MSGFKRYLGDGVYIDFNFKGHASFILTAENGTPVPTNTIFLEPEVAIALVEYLREMMSQPVGGSEAKR